MLVLGVRRSPDLWIELHIDLTQVSINPQIVLCRTVSNPVCIFFSSTQGPLDSNPCLRCVASWNYLNYSVSNFSLLLHKGSHYDPTVRPLVCRGDSEVALIRASTPRAS